MKTNKNNTLKIKTAIISSIILGLTALSSTARPQQYSPHRNQHVKAVAHHQAHAHQNHGCISHLPSNRVVVKYGRSNYYFVANTCYIYTSRGYLKVTKPRGLNYHYTAPRSSHNHNNGSKYSKPQYRAQHGTRGGSSRHR